MASGRLYTPTAVGTSNTTLYIVPSSTYSVFNVSLTNTSTSTVTVKLALASSATPNSADWIEWNTSIVGNGTFERTGLVLQAGYYVVATASTGSVINATVYGIETSTA